MYLMNLNHAPRFLTGGIEHHESVARSQPVPKAQGQTNCYIVVDWCYSYGVDGRLKLGQKFMDCPEGNPNRQSPQ
jgi:hypothetical protein